MKRIAAGAPEPDKDFSLTYEIGSGAGPFQPTNSGLIDEEKRACQLTKSADGNVTSFTMDAVLEKADENGNAYMYFVEETSASGQTSYNTYYGSFIDGTGAYAPGAKYAGSGEVIINQEYSGYELPSTGGIGTRSFTVLGTGLIAGAGCLLWKRRELL